MSAHWKDHGWAENLIEMVLPGGHVHLLENMNTGEFRKIWVPDTLTVGEAISHGNYWVDDEADTEEKYDTRDGIIRQGTYSNKDYAEQDDINKDSIREVHDRPEKRSSGGNGEQDVSFLGFIAAAVVETLFFTQVGRLVLVGILAYGSGYYVGLSNHSAPPQSAEEGRQPAQRAQTPMPSAPTPSDVSTRTAPSQQPSSRTQTIGFGPSPPPTPEEAYWRRVQDVQGRAVDTESRQVADDGVGVQDTPRRQNGPAETGGDRRSQSSAVLCVMPEGGERTITAEACRSSGGVIYR